MKKGLSGLLILVSIVLILGFASAFDAAGKVAPGHYGSQIANGTITGQQMANNLALTGNMSSNGFFFVNGSRVGIGTADPGQAFTVVGNTNITGMLNISGRILIGGGSPTAGYLLTASDSSGLASWTAPGSISGVGNISGDGVNGYFAYFQAQNRINSSSLVYFDEANGRVGIGTTSPQGKLHIVDGPGRDRGWNASIEISPSEARFPSLYFSGQNNTSYSAIVWTNSTSGIDSARVMGELIVQPNATSTGASMQFRTSDGAGPVERMRINEYGNVGIGTTIPDQKLTVSGNINVSGSLFVKSSADIVNIGTIGSTSALQLASNGNDVRLQTVAAGRNITFFTSSTTERMRILDSNGNVGIGTTNPDRKLHIEGATNLASSIHLRNTAGSPTNDWFIIPQSSTRKLQFSNDSIGNLIQMTLTNDGKLGLGTTNPVGVVHIRNTTAGSEGSIRIENPKSLGSVVYFQNETDIVGAVGRPTAENNIIISNRLGVVLRVGADVNKVFIMEDNTALHTSANIPAGSLVLGSGALCVDNGGNNCDDVARTAGNINAAGTITGSSVDVAERFSSTESFEPGSVVVIDTTSSERLTLSTKAYDSTVAGIVSTKPGVILGGWKNMTGAEVLLGLTGRVPVKVTNENGPIKVGDLLTTSSTPGHAMKCIDRAKCTGAIIGKALEPLNSEKGKIVVLIMNQ